MKMLGKRILFEEITENTTKSGIILTEPKKEKVVKGVILEAADNCEVLKAGMKIIADRYKLTKHDLNGKETFICFEDDVLAVLEE